MVLDSRPDQRRFAVVAFARLEFRALRDESADDLRIARARGRHEDGLAFDQRVTGIGARAQ